ncbi:MAG TPA: hypothetical protein VFW11_00100 [Cyclobacteriaceae bacterium]|nr:hypothetical protein [Cyclobacteriaceae bacterium]
MSTVELKNILIHRISEITDVSFLEALKTILDSKSESTVLTLTNEQRNEILASKKEIEQGLYIENSDLEKEINGWLNAK